MSMSVRVNKSLMPVLQQVQQILRHCGPAGLSLLGNVHNALHRHLPYEFVVDSLSDFKAGMAKSPFLADATRTDESITIYAQNIGALRNLLAKQDLISWDKRMEFKPIPPLYVSVLQEASGRKGTWKHAYEDTHYVVHAADPSKQLPVLSDDQKVCGYHLGSLHPSHAEQLVAEWKYTEGGTLEYLTSQLQHGISVAAYEDASRAANLSESTSVEAMTRPVANALHADDMSIMHLYVAPEHRNKGLGTLVLSELARKIHAWHIPAYGYIHVENIVSQRAFTRCGMPQQPGIWHWLEFVPHGSEGRP